jgi:BA14K-like protein
MSFLGSSSPPARQAMARYLTFDALVSALAVRHELVTRRGKAMRLAVYGAVLVITLGSVLLGLDWLSAPMSPMVDTEAGLHAPPAVRPPPAPVAVSPVAPNAPIGAPIVSPSLVAPSAPSAPPAATAQTPPPIAAPDPQVPQVQCHVEACTAAYRSFRASDCTYMPSVGQRRLCTK